MYRNPEQLVILLEPVYSSAVKYCIALTKNEVEAKDLLQDSLLKAITGFRSLNDDTKFKSWFFKIITREFYALYRKTLSVKRFLNNVQQEKIEFPAVFKNEVTDPQQVALLNALKMISEKERVAIVLFEVCEFSMEEIRAMQGEKSLSAIKSRLSRTRDKLRELLIENKQLINKSYEK
jgi:RNA polymerase sigma-70 factor (ECF subfamily)